MNKELILNTDLLDILFYKRNKLYGAYTLRKFYPIRVKIALVIMFGLVTLLSAFTFLPTKTVVTNPEIETILVSIKLPVQDKKYERPKTIIKPVTKQVDQGKFLQNIVFVHKIDSADQLNDISKLQIGSTTFLNLQDGPVDDGPLNTKGNDEVGLKSPSPSPIDVAKQLPYENPDIQASYPGGENALIRFLEKNLQVPQTLESQQTIQVKVKFVVDFEGNLQSFNVVQDGGAPFNAEVVRVLKKMPKWSPGKKGGQNVPVFYTIPVKFTADE
jgi:protein TonB